MSITHEETAVIAPSCKHENVKVEMSHTENINKPNHTTIQFVCQQCNAKAYIHTPQGEVHLGIVHWTWEKLSRGSKPTQTAQRPKLSKEEQLRQAERDIVAKLDGDGVGTRLAIRFFRAGYVASCGACDDAARNMNQLGPDGCQTQLDELVEEMLPRAEEWLTKAHPLAKKLGAVAGVDKMIIRRELRKELLAAITEYKTGESL